MKVGLTQSVGRLAELEPLLKAAGFEVLRQPLIETKTIRGVDLKPLQACPWWLFSSAAAVQAVQELGASLMGRKLGVVGEATALALEENGGEVLLKAESSAQSLLEAFLVLGEVGPVGLPQGNRALPTLAEGLQKSGYVVRVVTVYQAEVIPWKSPLVPDITLIASPSALEALPESFARKTRFVALGSTTAEALVARGRNCVVPKGVAAQDVLEAIKSLAKQPAGGMDAH